MMSGSTLDAMAAAVEGAHCVLICITERYKVRACAAACFLPHGATTARGVTRRQDALLTRRGSGPRVQTSANCRLEGTCASPPAVWPHRCQCVAMRWRRLAPVVACRQTFSVAHASDVHEQRKPWVPLMLEEAYRPSGWLGIMCVALLAARRR